MSNTRPIESDLVPIGTGRIRWAYGITTVPSRIDTLLPQTINSLYQAGFTNPHIFVDGTSDAIQYHKRFKSDGITIRYPAVRVANNWILSIYELYMHDPTVDRYALFQDDLITYKNLGAYLERCEFPEEGYWNLYTFPSNQSVCPVDETQKHKQKVGWYSGYQLGKGAVALIFSRKALTTLLKQPHLVDRIQNVHRGWRSIDGGISESMRLIGWTEFVHNPSLVQHTGLKSSWGNSPQLQAESFRGEQFDAMELLKEKVQTT